MQRHPRHADVAVDEGLARHAVAAGKLGLRQVLALLVLDRVGVLQALLDAAAAGAADPAAALERDAALLADRDAQQVARLGDRHDLVVVGDEGDVDHRFTSRTSLPFASSSSSLRARSSVANFGRNLDGTRLTAEEASTIRTFTSRSSFAMT